MASEVFTPTDLLAGRNPITKQVTVLSGLTLAAGAVLGRTLRSIGDGSADTGNTGDGTLTVNGMGDKTKVGDYYLECVETSADGGRFKVLDPDGNRLDDLTVGTTYSNEHLDVDLADGGTDFALGDNFTITVSEDPDKKAQLVDSTAVDGSEHPYAVLAQDADASDGDKVTVAYIRAQVNEDALSFGGSDTIDTHREEMEAKGLIPRSPVSR